MKKLLLVPFLFSCWYIHAQNLKLPQPNVWLRADQIVDDSGFWSDQSGNNNNGIPINSSNFESTNLINFNKAVSFNGLDTKLKIPFNLSNTSILTIITVYNTNDDTNERSIWSATINPNQDVSLSTQKLSSPQGIARFSQSNINLPVVNTSSQYWGKAGEGVDSAYITLGGLITDTSEVSLFSGDIAEFIVFDHMLGSDENQLLQSYLALKYGTTFQLSDYISSSGVIVWDYQNNPDFSSAIAGLGRDDNFGLYQKQSSNVEEQGLLTIGIQQITETNNENTSDLKDKNFLVWGMNELDPSPELSQEEIYPYPYPIMQRKWQMQVTGNDINKLPTSLQFNVKDIILESTNCFLALDKTGTGDFTSEEIEYIKADSISNDGIAYFGNIIWDEDNSGSDIFTLSFGMNNGVSCTHPICHNDATGAIDLQIMGGNAPYSYNMYNDSISYSKIWTADSRFQSIDHLPSGTYYLKVTDSDGNLATNTVTINNPDEFTTGLESTYTLKMGSQLTLNGALNVDATETSFIWESDNGFYSTNDVVDIIQPGEYTLTLINDNGCQATQSIQVNPLNNILYNYKLYPNPSNGEYALDIALSDNSFIQVSIFNMQGRMISKENRDGSSNYSFKGYIENSGLYFIEIQTSFGKETFKLIVNN